MVLKYNVMHHVLIKIKDPVTFKNFAHFDQNFKDRVINDDLSIRTKLDKIDCLLKHAILEEQHHGSHMYYDWIFTRPLSTDERHFVLTHGSPTYCNVQVEEKIKYRLYDGNKRFSLSEIQKKYNRFMSGQCPECRAVGLLSISITKYHLKFKCMCCFCYTSDHY